MQEKDIEVYLKKITKLEKYQKICCNIKNKFCFYL